MRRVAFLAGLAILVPSILFGEIIDRIAAIVNSHAITTSEVTQYDTLRIIPRNESESDRAYRSRILEAMINHALRHEDMERFGVEAVSEAQVEDRVAAIRARFETDDAFREALTTAEMGLDDLEDLVEHQLEVERYIEERFSPLIFVSLEEIENYYREVWVPERRSEGVTVRPLSAVQDEIRARLRRDRLETEVERWTAELRNRSNVDVYGAR